MCSIWQLPSYKGKRPLSIQCKRGMWYNLRPGSENDFRCDTKTAQIFIDAICQSIRECPNMISEKEEKINQIKQQFLKCSL